MIVGRRWLRDRRRGLVWWCLGIVALVASTVAVFPTVAGDESFEQLAEDLPPSLRALVGLADGVPLTSAPGYLHTRLFSTLLPLLLVVLAIGLGARALGGSEEDGTLELLVAQPVERGRVVVERYLANAALLAVVTSVFLTALVGMAWPVGALDGVDGAGLAGATVGAFALAQLHGSVAYAVGAARGRRAPAVGVATAVAAAGYVVQGLLSLSDAVAPLRFVSPWHWYLGRNMLTDGVAPDAVVVPLVLSVALAAASVPVFARRDLR